MSASFIIINQYAKAAFNAAKKSGTQDKFLEGMKLLLDNFSANIFKELSNPAISKASLSAIISELGKKLSISSEVTEFLIIVARSRRIGYLKEIYQQFLKFSKLDKNILEVKLYSAQELDLSQTAEIKDLLQKKYPQNIIEINHIIDKTILGGILIKIDSMVIDASLKNQLLSIEKACKSIIA